MRRLLIPVLLLGVAACERNPAPVVAGSAMAPPPGAAAAQSVPAGATPQVGATVAGLDAASAAAAGADPTPADERPPASADDSRWVDVDPNQLDVPATDGLADFQAQQQQRDAELMQHDAEEAGALANQPRRDDEARDDGNDEPPPRYAPEYPPEYPPDERDQGEYPDPPPDDADDWGDEPPPDEDYDPRYDNGRR